MEVVVKTEGTVQSCSQTITINKPTRSFYKLDVLPVAQPIISQHWRKTTSHFTAHGYC